MADDDLRQAFTDADVNQRRLLAHRPEYRDIVEELVGPGAVDGYERLPDPDVAGHLAGQANPNLVFIPGIMGSLLKPNALAGIWWLDVRTRKRLDQLGLTADGNHDAAGREIDIQPTGVDFSYEEFLLRTLAETGLSNRTFAFDWRKRLNDSADLLESHINDLRAENGNQPVHLVGHSMGGLMIRTALCERPGLWNKIGKIVYIGTPHYGAAAIAGYLKGHFWGTEAIAALGLYISRRTFQSMWGGLSLLPAPAGIYPNTTSGGDHPCANFDLYAVDDYELDFDRSEHRDELQTILNFVKQQWKDLNAAHAASDLDQLERQLMIAGVGQKTLFRLDRDGAWFGLRDAKHTKREPGNINREGDSRVPLASAMLPGVQTRYIQGSHGGLPNLPPVSSTTFDFLQDRPLADDATYRTPAEALAEHLSATSLPAAAALTTSDQTDLYDPLLFPSEMTDTERTALDQRIENGQVSMARLHIL